MAIMTLPNVTASDYNDDYDYCGDNNQSYMHVALEA